MFGLTGILGLFGLTLLVLLVVACFTKKAEPQPTRTDVNEPAGWGPCGFLFPKSWVYVWWGYLAMVGFTAVILPVVSEAVSPNLSAGMVAQSEMIEVLLTIGPFIHCILMPILWTHKHREVKKWIEKRENEDIVETSELDPEATTVIFSIKLGCGKSVTVCLADLTIGLVELGLKGIKYASVGTINLNAFWFPSPFYSFWRAKMQIGLVQINGAKICTSANQGDAYMKFCTEAMLNFWTLGMYGMCCSKRTSYGRWLDRHVLWQGAPPKGYTNRELAPLELPPPLPTLDPHEPRPAPILTPSLAPRQSFVSSTISSAAASRSRSTFLGCCSSCSVGSSRWSRIQHRLKHQRGPADSAAHVFRPTTSQDHRWALAVWTGASLVLVHDQAAQHEVRRLRPNVFRGFHLVQLHQKVLYHRGLRSLWHAGQGMGGYVHCDG